MPFRTVSKLLATALLVSRATAAPPAAQPAPADEFRKLLEVEWRRTLEENPTWASSLGDRRWNDRWPDLSPAGFERRTVHAKELVATLEGFDRGALSAADRLSLDLLLYETKIALEDASRHAYVFVLNQREGIQLADELADALRFETVKDYEDWLGRLRAFPLYMSQTIELLRQGIRERRLQPKVVLERVPKQIDQQISSAPDAHPFFRPLCTWPASVPPPEQARLADAARNLIASAVVPAFVQLREFLQVEYLPACFDRAGVWQCEGGEDYYAHCVRKFTTTRLGPREIHEIGLREVERITREMESIRERVGFQGTLREFFQRLRTDPQFYLATPAALLERYRAVAKRIDPELVKVFRTLPRMPYGVEPIPDKAAPATTTAYYRPGAADGSRAGTFFVNLYRPEMRPTYEMMALALHEAVPGHHLQIALAMEQQDLPDFRRNGAESAYTAYVEGWALYAESLGEEMGLYDDPYSRFGQLTYEMWRAVRLVVDTGIHSLRWTRQQAIDYFLDHAPKTELDVVNEIDRYIAWPGQALAYKIGELKIRELRQRSARALGEKLDLREFHDVVLSSGAVPLEVLERRVEDWLKQRRDP